MAGIDLGHVALRHLVDGPRAAELGVADHTLRTVSGARAADFDEGCVGSAHLHIRSCAQRARGPALRLRLRGGEQDEQSDDDGKKLVHNCLQGSRFSKKA